MQNAEFFLFTAHSSHVLLLTALLSHQSSVDQQLYEAGSPKTQGFGGEAGEAGEAWEAWEAWQAVELRGGRGVSGGWVKHFKMTNIHTTSI